MFDTTSVNLRSIVVVEGPNRSMVQRIEGNMRDKTLIKNPTLKLTTPTWRLAIRALLRQVLLGRDYQERNNPSPNEGSV